MIAGQLYGRRTGQLRLEPFDARDAGLFQPRYSAEDRVRTFAVCGGVPYYLDRFRDDRPLVENLRTGVFECAGLLHEETELLLRQSIPDPTDHIAVLRSIAHGHNRNNRVSERTRLAPAHVTELLDAMERLGLVERLRPITASPRSRKTAYAIADQFLRFHHRFVDPARSQLRTPQLAAHYLHETVLPQLDEFTSRAWETICQQHVLRTVPGVTAAGRWWGPVCSAVPRNARSTSSASTGTAGRSCSACANGRTVRSGSPSCTCWTASPRTPAPTPTSTASCTPGPGSTRACASRPGRPWTW